MLRNTGLFDVPHAAVDLNGERSCFDTHVGAETLRHRNEQFNKFLIALANIFIGMMRSHIERVRIHIDDCSQCVDDCSHGEQHAAHIRKVDDVTHSTVLRRRNARRTTLTALLRILQCVLIRALGQRQTFEAD